MAALLSPLRSRPFRWLLAGQAFSLIGDRLNYLALVAVLSERTSQFRTAGGAGTLSGLAVALLLPAALLSPWAAGRIDRWARRDVMIQADAARAALTLGLAFAVPWLPTWGALTLVGVGAVANVFFLPARLAIVPELVRQDELNPANALGLLASVLATLFGTLLGGPLLALIGVRGALIADAATFAISVLTLLQLPRRAAADEDATGGLLRPAAPPVEAGASTPPTPRQAPGAASPRPLWPGARGFAELFRTERSVAAALLIWTTWIVGALLHVCGTLRIQELSPRITDLLAPALAAVGGGGAIGAAFFGSRLRRARSLLSGVGLWVAAVGLGLLALATDPAWIVAAAFVTGFATAPVYILADTELMEALPGSARGGAMAARDFFCKAGFLLVALGLGRLAGPASAPGWIAGGAVALAALGAYYAVRRPLRS
ncbi:MAG: MFS transporter [Candidatus Eisenbacteria bacterium]|nr:MFS transporter [Candidatus Eisenbacteria bacterium]